MTTHTSPKPEIPWDQTAFEALKATWSPERIAEDERVLKEIFKLAEASPLMAEALEWAREHGLKFFIDRQAVNCGGYYAEGTGVLAATAAMVADPANAVKVITHEIRHAWQDYHGLCAPDFPIIANNPDFTKHFIRYALAEADAKAFGERAADEYEVTRLGSKKFLPLRKSDQAKLASLQASLKDEKAYLQGKFLGWFSNSWIARFYGDFASKLYGQSYGLYKGNLPVEGVEFRSAVPPVGSGLNINNVQDVLQQLGQNFSGTKNYLAKLQPDILPKKIISPSLAHIFWGAANDDQKKLTTELRKACLRVKTNPKNLPKRHPWP